MKARVNKKSSAKAAVMRPQYRSRVEKNKKAYTRKEKHRSSLV